MKNFVIPHTYTSSRPRATPVRLASLVAAVLHCTHGHRLAAAGDLLCVVGVFFGGVLSLSNSSFRLLRQVEGVSYFDVTLSHCSLL